MGESTLWIVATVTVAAANVLLPVGGRPDNPSLMNRPYVLAWLAFSGFVLACVAWGIHRTGRRQRASITR